MYDIGFVETIFEIFWLWTVSSFSYKKRLSPVSSYSPDALNVFKTAKFSSSSIDLCQQTYYARYWVCRDSLLLRFSNSRQCSRYHSHLFASIHGLSASIWYQSVYHATHNPKLCSSSNDLCQSSHHARYWVCRDNNYHFPTFDRFFLFLYKRQPPVSSCAPDVFNAFKTAKFCSSTIILCQQRHHAWYWVCRDNNYGILTLDSFFLLLYRKAAPSEQLCSWRT